MCLYIVCVYVCVCIYIVFVDTVNVTTYSEFI